jgi:hypothetical protein
VAGTGRSGTSTISGILSRLGLHVPQPEVAPDPSNPRGFCEPRWVVDFHDRLLARCGVQVADARPAAWRLAESYDDADARLLGDWLEAQLSASPRLLVKVPRSLRFLPRWVSVGAARGVAPDFLTMLRPPAEVVGSRRAQYNRGLEDAHGVAGWVNLMLGTELATRGSRRVVVNYHALLADWAGTTRAACAGLGLDDLWLAVSDPHLAARMDAFVDPGLRRVRASWDDLVLPDRMAGVARAAWEALVTGDRVALDAARAELAEVYAEAEAVARSSVLAAAGPSHSPAAVNRPSRRRLRPFIRFS